MPTHKYKTRKRKSKQSRRKSKQSRRKSRKTTRRRTRKHSIKRKSKRTRRKSKRTRRKSKRSQRKSKRSRRKTHRRKYSRRTSRKQSRRSKKQKGGSTPRLYEESPHVIELTRKDFDDEYNLIHPRFQNKMGYIMGYADWCPHCYNPETQKMWNDFGEEMDEYDVPVGAINCNADKEVGSALGIQGYPTILIVVDDGSMQQYAGARDPKQLKQKMCDIKASARFC